MNKIKLENVLCHGCLSSDRRITTLGEYSETFLNSFNNYEPCLINSSGDIKCCWECMALLKKFKSFQNQIKHAQNVLVQMIYGLDQNPVCLSKLTSKKVYYYNHEVQHLERKQECIETITAITETNKESLNITNQPKETLENVIEDNEKTDSLIKLVKAEEISDNIEYPLEIDIPNTKNEPMESDDNDQTTFSDEVNSELIKTKKRKSNNNSEVKSKLCREYMTVIKSNKKDWGDVTKYFTMTSLDEHELKKCMFRKKRFSDYRKYSFKCMLCKIGFHRLIDFQRHNDLNHQKPGVFKCCHCRATMPSHESLAQHWGDHIPMAKCNMCSDYVVPHYMKRHLNNSHTNMYACYFCDMKLGTVSKFIRHFYQMHQSKCICDYCKKTFKSKIYMENHIRIYHMEMSCAECGRACRNSKELARHREDAHPTPDYKPELAFCVECNKQYGSVRLYRHHVKDRHQGTRYERTACPVCNRVFARKDFMKNHYNLYHTGKTKYYCKICDKYFSRGAGLKVHNTHVHQKVERRKDKICDLCGRGFFDNRTLLNHRRTHTGERPHECPHCPARFIQRYAMTTHIRTQHK